ncbi:MAG: nucleotide exchange factor GrpE [bacterium]
MNKNNKHNIEIKDGKSKKATEEKESNKPEISEEPETNEAKEVAELKDKILRKAAEFENYKRRTDTEISNYIKYASENLIVDLIPVYDDLSRAIDSMNKGETKDFETLKKGVTLIYEKFRSIFEREGVTEINSLGQEFNVDVNAALMQIPRDDIKPNTVLDVIEKGYKLKDKVVKHEKVFVSSEPI